MTERGDWKARPPSCGGDVHRWGSLKPHHRPAAPVTTLVMRAEGHAGASNTIYQQTGRNHPDGFQQSINDGPIVRTNRQMYKQGPSMEGRDWLTNAEFGKGICCHPFNIVHYNAEI